MNKSSLQQRLHDFNSFLKLEAEEKVRADKEREDEAAKKKRKHGKR